MSPSPGTVVSTSCTFGSARRIVSAWVATARTASPGTPAGGTMLTWRTFSDPVEMNCVGRRPTIETDPKKRSVASPRTPSLVRRSRSTKRIVGA